jgi:hypothetical protein
MGPEAQALSKTEPKAAAIRPKLKGEEEEVGIDVMAVSWINGAGSGKP